MQRFPCKLGRTSGNVRLSRVITRAAAHPLYMLGFVARASVYGVVCRSSVPAGVSDRDGKAHATHEIPGLEEYIEVA